MSKLDEQKEHIGALKVYLGFILAIILSIGTGIIKLYIAREDEILFWIGVVIILFAMIIFSLIAKKMHKAISDLKDL